MVFVSSKRSHTNTGVTRSGQERGIARQWDCEGDLVVREAEVVEVNLFGVQHILGMRLSSPHLTKQTRTRAKLLDKGKLDDSLFVGRL